MGVDGQRVSDATALAKAIDAGLRTRGPYLVEVAL
jgi:thiamine pyrophosphate-dependent acetolactate synthase large subunit-like protein